MLDANAPDKCFEFYISADDIEKSLTTEKIGEGAHGKVFALVSKQPQRTRLVVKVRSDSYSGLEEMFSFVAYWV